MRAAAAWRHPAPRAASCSDARRAARSGKRRRDRKPRRHALIAPCSRHARPRRARTPRAPPARASGTAGRPSRRARGDRGRAISRGPLVPNTTGTLARDARRAKRDLRVDDVALLERIDDQRVDRVVGGHRGEHLPEGLARPAGVDGVREHRQRRQQSARDPSPSARRADGTRTPRLRSTSVMNKPGPACAVTTPMPGDRGRRHAAHHQRSHRVDQLTDVVDDDRARLSERGP